MRIQSPRLRTMALVASALACAAAVALAAVSSSSSARARSVPTPREAIALPVRLGIDAKAAAIAGVSAVQLQALIQNGIEYAQAEGEAIQSADAAVASARANLDQLERQASSGRLGRDPHATVEAARTQLRGALANRVSTLDAAFNEIAGDLSPSQVAMLRRIASNRQREVPVEFCVLDRTDAEWASLRAAFEARASRRQVALAGITVPEVADDAVLTSAESDPTVVAARSALANVPALEQVWGQAIEQAR